MSALEHGIQLNCLQCRQARNEFREKTNRQSNTSLKTPIGPSYDKSKYKWSLKFDFNERTSTKKFFYTYFVNIYDWK